MGKSRIASPKRSHEITKTEEPATRHAIPPTRTTKQMAKFTCNDFLSQSPSGAHFHFPGSVNLSGAALPVATPTALLNQPTTLLAAAPDKTVAFSLGFVCAPLLVFGVDSSTNCSCCHSSTSLFLAESASNGIFRKRITERCLCRMMVIILSCLPHDDPSQKSSFRKPHSLAR